MSESTEQQLEKSQRWVEKVVVGLNLCPFAKPVLKANSLRYALSSECTPEQLAKFFLIELDIISQADEAVIATTLVVMPEGLTDFYDYLDFLADCEDLLQKSGLQSEFQLASFHPDYIFAGVDEDDASHLTNRSPYPMLHIIREAQMSRVLANHPNPEKIPERNIQLLREMGKTAVLELCDDDC
jgi:hypothetical protein